MTPKEQLLEDRSPEEKLLEQLYRGEEADANNASISTRLLRQHLLEMANSNGKDVIAQRVCPRWVIHNALFEHTLDLRDARRRGGGSLSAIEFHDCEFQAGFQADGAHLDRLEFKDCKFTSKKAK